MPFIWGAYNGSEYRQFTTTKDFVEFISQRDAYVYAHNGGKFDWHYCLKWLEPFDDTMMVINGRLSKFTIGLCEFRDSYNILPCKLSAYKKDDIDYALFEPELREKPENWQKICDYLKSDCVYLYDLISKFIDTYGFNLTLASAAMKQWRNISGEKTPKTTRRFYNDFGEFYYGGRVQAFATGIYRGYFKVIDINSAYPFAMMHKHPYGDHYVLSDTLPESRSCIERCFITVSCVARGCFPFRLDTGELVFPDDGERRTYRVTGWEYLAGLETGAISDVIVLEVYKFTDSIDFRDYVDHFYKLKEYAAKHLGKNSPEYIYAKLFLNSLYGKFGSNPQKYRNYTVVQPRYIEAANAAYGYEFGSYLGDLALVSKRLEDYEQRYFNVAVSASITGFVRAYMWRALSAVKVPMYCDTDSIFCVDTGNLDLDPTRLGAWDVEAECDYGAFGGKKLYAARTLGGAWKTASKGVRLTPAQLIKVAKGRSVTYTPESPSYSLKRGVRYQSRTVEKVVDLDFMDLVDL